ncbi:MAG: hypothetical protein KF819_09075 [Labilithrix sp.]|nr:hypothetical protein [Labilithrix sp.]
MKRSFVLVGRHATASADFSLVDIAGTSGRLDVLLRGLRAALLVSHGVRRDTIAYLVLLGGARAKADAHPAGPRVIKIAGETAKFLRPDERALATLVQKTLAHDQESGAFVEVRPGVCLAAAGIDAVIADVGDAELFVLEEGGRDVRELPAFTRDVALFVGGHDGFDDVTRAKLDALGARAIRVGPTSIHADDAIAVVHNELDRRDA